MDVNVKKIPTKIQQKNSVSNLFGLGRCRRTATATRIREKYSKTSVSLQVASPLGGGRRARTPNTRKFREKYINHERQSFGSHSLGGRRFSLVFPLEEEGVQGQ